MISFLKTGSGVKLPPLLNGRRVFLRTPNLEDFSEWAALRERSRAFLTPWEPVWQPGDLTRASFRRRIRRYHQEIREGRGYAFLIFGKETDALLGGVTLTNVRRGVTQSCSIGYWMGEPFAGKGFMKDAVETVIPFIFNRLGLHRIEAACLPDNAASIRLLEGIGFQREGFAREYLCINGKWRDHILFGLLAEDMRDKPREIGLAKSIVRNDSL